MTFSVEQFNAIDEFERLMGVLREQSNRLTAMLSEAEVIRQEIYPLPKLSRAEEKDPPTDVSVAPVVGVQARSALLSSMSDWHFDMGMSGRFVSRTPGVWVGRHTEPTTILTLVEAINQTKDALQATMARMGDRHDRFALISTRFKRLVLKQLTRHLLVLPPAPAVQSVRFTWGQKVAIKKITRQEAIEMVGRYRADGPSEGADPSSFESWVQDDISALMSLAESDELRVRRVLRPRPMMNLRFTIDQDGNDHPQTLLREAHTPVIIVNPQRDVRVGPLKSFVAADRAGKPPRSDSGRYEPVSHCAPIYRVL